MKKFLVLTVMIAAVAVAVLAEANPQMLNHGVSAVEPLIVWSEEYIAANPVPVLIALGTLVFTIAYHTIKGRALRRALVAASTQSPESPVVVRAKARATRAQLIADQIQLENRLRKLPAEVKAAEKDACYTEQAVQEARRLLVTKLKAHEEAVRKLNQLRQELRENEQELVAIREELEKLADQV
ncbi:MAG: hypothetical protein RMJ56_11660 [Gemmataceae bacterium]|nr:hypothetical protein [Gemmata sp.]MDW8198248.1 hypothetical protein [Gemmataceae bacterium]